jgi:hypothetical protein
MDARAWGLTDGPRRALQQTADGVTIVLHPADFVAAVSFGAEHIEVRTHLDYTKFGNIDPELVWGPAWVQDKTKTIRVQCLSLQSAGTACKAPNRATRADAEAYCRVIAATQCRARRYWACRGPPC